MRSESEVPLWEPPSTAQNEFTEVKVTLCQPLCDTHAASCGSSDLGSIPLKTIWAFARSEHSISHAIWINPSRWGVCLEPILREACSQAYPVSAICVQRFDDSLSSAIRITYRISLRSSSLREPRYPLLRVVLVSYFWRSKAVKISTVVWKRC